MLTKEQIKKLCELGVDGFEIDSLSDLVITPDFNQYSFSLSLNYLSEHNWRKVYYPLFLQRAIEAVNREGRYIIIQTHQEIKIYEKGSFFSIPEITYKYSDEAKEEGLIYYLDNLD